MKIALTRNNILLAAWGPVALAQQLITRRPSHPVKPVADFPTLSAEIVRLGWKPDPWDGKLDWNYSPQWMQAILDGEEPPLKGGPDCDDITVIAANKILKSGLATEVWVGVCLWEKSGHAVCLFPRGDQWHHVGNWNGGVPVPCGRTTWPHELKKDAKVVSAGMWRCRMLPGDLMTFDRYERLV